MKRWMVVVFFPVLCVAVALVLSSGVANAGWLDKVKDTAGKAGEKALDKALSEPEEKAKPESDDDEEEAAEDEGRSKKKGSKASAPAEEEKEAAYDKFDFIPGDKTIFADDFSDTDVGEFPRKWNVDGPYGGGDSVEVVKYKGQNFLRSNSNGTAAIVYVTLKTKGDMPKKFTIEYDAVIGTDNDRSSEDSNRYTLLMLGGKEPNNAGLMHNKIFLSGDSARSSHTDRDFPKSKSKNDNKVHRISISVNDTFVKAYIDNERVINDPNAVSRPIKHIGMEFYSGTGSRNQLITNFRIAEGGKDIASALSTDGKIVTHGILFDTGSDKIKPESAPTLKMILGLLNDDEKLKFSIEGHTDNQGSKATNQTLSEKRAVSVKAWLVDKGIDAGRLSTKGFGDTKAIDGNNTPEGRANNRRVEFVKK